MGYTFELDRQRLFHSFEIPDVQLGLHFFLIQNVTNLQHL